MEGYSMAVISKINESVNKDLGPIKKDVKKKNIRWWLITVLLIGAVVNYLDRSNLSIANTTIAKEFGLSSTQMGLLLSAFLWPYALANLPAGWLVDKYGPKKCLHGHLAYGLWQR